MSGVGDEYQCARCGGTFEKGWSDEEAMDEMLDTWQGQSGDVVVICDDCFEQVMAWAKANHPEFLRYSN